MKRILYYETTGSGGGSSVSLKILTEALDRTQFEPVFLFGNKGNQTRWAGENIHEYHGSSLDNCDFSPSVISLVGIYRLLLFLFLSLREVFFLPLVFRRIKPDLVHINCGQAVMVGIICKAMSIPVIWHIRELVRKNWLGRVQDRIYARCATRIIAISHAVAGRLPVTVKRANVSVVYNAVDQQGDVPHSVESLRAQYGFGVDDFVVLLLGTVNPDKGYDFLAKVDGVTKSCSSVKYILAGQVEDRRVGFFHALLRVIYRKSRGGIGKLRLEREDILKVWDDAIQCGRAIFPGRVNGAEAIHAANIVVCPNRTSEPFGRTVIEAYAGGRPVLAMAVQAFDETVIDGETGYLLDPDPALWAEKILSLSSDSLNMCKLGSHAREISKKYNVADHVNAVCSIYEQIFAKGN